MQFNSLKRSLHEGGVRVPGLLIWPEKIKRAYATDIPCVTSYYLPAIMDVLGMDKSKAANQLDGISLLLLIEGRMNERPIPIEILVISYSPGPDLDCGRTK